MGSQKMLSKPSIFLKKIKKNWKSSKTQFFLIFEQIFNFSW
jgi:hypothetical protein